MIRSRILGTGRGVPSKRLTNADLEQLVDTSDTWIVERTGIRERRVLEPGRVTSDLAAEAGGAALAAAGVSPRDVDCIIVATISPDMPCPATALFVQRKLGIGACAAFDLSAACAGFIYAMGVADAFVKTRQFQRVLVIGVEILTSVTNWKDRNTCILFGDGAGAVLLGPEGQPEGARPRGILSTHLYADAVGADYLNLPGGGTQTPLTRDNIDEGLQYLRMNGKMVFTHAVRNIAASCLAALEANAMTVGDVDLVVAHQANLRILEGVSQRLGLPMAKFYLNIERYGNTSSASIPIALDEAVRDGTVKDGMSILMTALGAGFSWGSALVRW